MNRRRTALHLLFDSRARGDRRPDLHHDVVVFLESCDHDLDQPMRYRLCDQLQDDTMSLGRDDLAEHNTLMVNIAIRG